MVSHKPKVVHQLFYLNLHFCFFLMLPIAGTGSVGGSIKQYFKEIFEKKIQHLCAI